MTNLRGPFCFLWVSGILLAMLCFSAGAKGLSEIDEAQQYFREGNTYSANILLKELIKKDPHHSVALFYLGKLAEDGDAAADFFRKACSSKQDPTMAEEARFLLGQYSLAKGQYAEAAGYFESVLNEEPVTEWDTPAMIALAKVKKQTGEWSQADTFYQRVLSGAKDSVQKSVALSGLGDCRFQAGDFKKAAEQYEEALGLRNPDLSPYLYARLIKTCDELEESLGSNIYTSKLESEFPQSLELGKAPVNSEIKEENIQPKTAKPERQNDTPLGPPLIRQNEKVKINNEKSQTNQAQKQTTMPDQDISPKKSDSLPAEPKEKKPMESASGKTGYGVQVGAFSTRENAENLKKELKTSVRLGDSLSIEIANPKSLYIVRIGPFKEESAALKWGESKIRPLNKKFRVVVIP